MAAKKASKKTYRKRSTKKRTRGKVKASVSRKKNVLAAETYKDKKIEVVEGAVTPCLVVDGKEISAERDADTGLYFSRHHMPYARFSTLEEVGKAVVDSEE